MMGLKLNYVGKKGLLELPFSIQEDMTSYHLNVRQLIWNLIPTRDEIYT